MTNGTGTGKSLIAFGIATQEIEPRDEIFSYSSSLMSMEITPENNRPILPFSIILCPKNLINKWKSEAEKFLKSKYYIVINSKKDIYDTLSEEELPDDFEPTGNKKYIDEYYRFKSSLEALKDSRKILKTKIKELKDRGEKDEAKKLGSRLELVSHNYESEKTKFTNFCSVFKICNYFINEMKNKKIIICGSDAFSCLIPIFYSYRVERLFIDEPQVIQISSPEEFRNISYCESLDFLHNPLLVSRRPFEESSPANFVWLISATVHQIVDNLGSGKKNINRVARYINNWIGRNGPFFRDYINSIKGHYRFPEFTKKYIIKLSRSTTLLEIFGKKNLYKRINVKCKNPIIRYRLNGLFDDIEETRILNEMIENDDNVGICRFFEIQSIDDLSDGIIKKLNKDIHKVETKIQECKLVGAAKDNYIEDKNIKLAALKEKKKLVEKRKRALVGIDSEESPQCIICYEELTFPKAKNIIDCIDKKCPVVCSVCSTGMHYDCFNKLIQTNGNICSVCRQSFHLNKPLFYSKDGKTLDIEEDEEKDKKKEDEKEEEIYDDKIEALKHYIRKSKKKVLLYTNLSGDGSNTFIQIVETCIDAGYEVTLPKNYTRRALVDMFGESKAKHIKSIKVQRDINIELQNFRETDEKTCWILDSFKQSAGLDFEFINTIICYSNFDSLVQVIGRAMRIGLEKKFKVIVFYYDLDGEEKADT